MQFFCTTLYRRYQKNGILAIHVGTEKMTIVGKQSRKGYLQVASVPLPVSTETA